MHHIRGSDLNLGSLSEQCSYLVTPNDTFCPNSTQIPCSNFSTYIQNVSLYFQSQTTFCFLPGEHLVGTTTSLLVTNVSDLALIGLGSFTHYSVADKVHEYGFTVNYDDDKSITYMQSTSVINCDTNFSFVLRNIANLSLINFTMVDCGASHIQEGFWLPNTTGIPNAAVLLINVSNLYLHGVSIQNSTGYGLLGINVLGQSEVSDSSFVGNNQVVRHVLQFYSQTIKFCMDGSYYSSPFIYINSAANRYAGGNALFVYFDTPNNNTVASTLAISSCLFTLSVDGSFQDLKTAKYTSRGTGLGIIMRQNSYAVNAFISNSVLYRNQASYGANLNFQVNPLNCNVTISNISSSRGRSLWGGGLYYAVIPSTAPANNINQNSFLTINSTFSADFNYPRCVYIVLSHQTSLATLVQMQQCVFLANIIIMSSALSRYIPVLYFTNSTFTAVKCGGGIGAYYSNITVADCTFDGTNIFALESYVSVSDSTFFNNVYTAPMELYDCELSLTGFVTFENNTSYDDGGALYLSQTNVILTAPVNVSFINNLAQYRGGAVYAVSNPQGFAQVPCMFQFNDPNGTLGHPGIHLYFDGNSAKLAGSVLFGGNIDTCPANCSLTPYVQNCSLLAIGAAITSFGINQNMSSLISSDAGRVCGCVGGVIICSQYDSTRTVYPGQLLQFSIVTVGQLDGISPDIVISYSCDVGGPDFSLSGIENCTEPSYFNEQHTGQQCTNYNYTVEGNNNQPIRSVVFLVPRTAYFLSYSNQPYYAFLDIQPCPYGFQYDQGSHICRCDPLLLAYGIECDINTEMVMRTGTFWIGNTTHNVLAVHSHCPNDYCIEDAAWISIADQSEQCSYNHTGVLCGRCIYNTSAVFGSVRCMPCSNIYLLLLVPIFLMGVLLVASLFVFNCTVSTGTINGLILYANIVRPGVLNLQLTLVQQSGFEKALLVIIDWLNLDLGIETCFYGGMDMYAKTWLQLLFPAYIFVLVGAVIVGSRWSTRLAWVCRRNAVPVLGTLVLLSYTKLLATIITIFLSTQLSVGDSNAINPRVWLVDGSVVYVQGKHIPLFVAGLIITAVFITPYTAILLLSPWLQAKSEWKMFRWVNKLKPFLDAYQAPFKDQYRYWPGVLLMVRVVLCLIFTTNDRNDISVNLLAMILVLSLYCCVANTLSVYKNWTLNVLDNFFLINMIFLTSLTLYIHNSNATINSVLTTISAGSSLTAFAGIVCFHVYLKVKDSKQMNTCSKVGKPRSLDTAVEYSGAQATLVTSSTYNIQHIMDSSESPFLKSYGTNTYREALVEDS